MLGWLSSKPRSTDERYILCLPGRHVKWVLTEGQTVKNFFTGMSGELEDVLLQHSLLGRGVLREASRDRYAFEDAMGIIFASPTLSLGHAMFATRGRLVLGELQSDEAAAFLSGLLVASDIRDALVAFNERGIDLPMIVLGNTPLCKIYTEVLAAQGRTVTQVVWKHLAVRGLFNFLHSLELNA